MTSSFCSALSDSVPSGRSTISPSLESADSTGVQEAEEGAGDAVRTQPATAKPARPLPWAVSSYRLADWEREVAAMPRFDTQPATPTIDLNALERECHQAAEREALRRAFLPQAGAWKV